MINLNALLIFAKVIEARSFSEAARRLDIPVSTVSRKVAEFENELGVRLIERSTRHLRPTQVGADIFEIATRGTELSEQVLNVVQNQLIEVKGTLRISVPPSIADTLLAPLATAFLASYPEVKLSIMVTDRVVDHISEGIDLALRVGKLNDSSLVARKLLAYRHQLVASPDYLEKHGEPAHPIELQQHKLVSFAYWNAQNSWTFCNAENQSESISFEPRITMNDYVGLARMIASGSGIGELPPIVQPHLINDGEIVEVMKDWSFPSVEVSLVHLGNRHAPRPVRLFIDFASQMVGSLFARLPS